LSRFDGANCIVRLSPAAEILMICLYIGQSGRAFSQKLLHCSQKVLWDLECGNGQH